MEWLLLLEIFIRLVRLKVTNFYDDFCQNSERLLDNMATGTVIVFRMLGRSGRRSAQAAQGVAIYECSLSMRRTVEDTLEIKKGRVEALQDLIKAICDRKELHQTELAAAWKLFDASSHTLAERQCAL